MTVLLVDWVIRNWNQTHWDRRAWLLAYRTVLVLFFLCVSLDYAPLWREYESSSGHLNVVAAVANVSAASIVLALLFAVARRRVARSLVGRSRPAR